MEISQAEMVHALERAQNSGAATPEQLASYVSGYIGALRYMEETSGQAVSVNVPIRVGDRIDDPADLNTLPEGSEVQDADGDYYLKYEDGWAWYKYHSGALRLEPADFYDASATLIGSFPATVVLVG